ncbi:NYN domain-containing protein [Humibacter sp.]|uniref:NYN domain-containing protein n=1 Tax=Humibacter sp. TaxID=1940291 RepID=UPI003F7F2372
MADTTESRVAVYIDFDNIVISRYDQVNGRNSFQRDRVRQFDASNGPESTDASLAAKLEASTVDVGAVIDFAASFGTLVLTRAYADWSAPVNAEYRHQLVGRAVDLVQLFPAAAYAKNGADIRLAVDAVEDMFRLPDLTHVVIVAGDSDYVPLAQRCKRLGRYVVGIGVAGSTSRTLAAACDEFYTYDALPGVARAAAPAEASAPATADDAVAGAAAKASKAAPKSKSTTKTPKRTASPEPAELDDAEEAGRDPQEEATGLLDRALRIGHEKDDSDWLHSSAVKSQIKRMDPSFSEKQLGYRSFSDFIKSRPEIAELDDSSTTQLVRLKPQPETATPAPKRAPRRAKG